MDNKIEAIKSVIKSVQSQYLYAMQSSEKTSVGSPLYYILKKALPKLKHQE